jgi:3-dehydroquinate dehydratase / shikimate dehydrogenase
MDLPILKTQRLVLRPWKKADLLPFAKINANPKVMEFYPATLTQAESHALAEKIQRDSVSRGYGFWAVEVPGVAGFIGYVGLNYWNLEASFAPCVDVGWRLDPKYWGYGYATEGALEVLKHGFETLQLPEIMAMATVGNFRSHQVMKRLGMTHDPQENFHHPKLPKDDPLSLRVLYRLSRIQWLTRTI